MPTERRDTITVTSKEYLIVAGGATRFFPSHRLNTVEVMDTKTLVWSTMPGQPPSPLQLYIRDRLWRSVDYHGKTKSVLACSLTELPQSSLSSSSFSIWHKIADATAYYSTCAAVNGELLAVCGCD